MQSLLSLLPSRHQPLLLRYGLTTLLVLIFFIFRLGVGPAAGQYSFIFFIPPTLIAAILFDRGSGFFGIALSALAVSALLNWSNDPIRHIGALTLFSIVMIFVVLVGEGMRNALENETAAQKATMLLLQEQDHRIKNELAIASSLISLQAKTHDEPTVREALEGAVARLNILAKSHDHLRVDADDNRVDMQAYLGQVCYQIGAALRGARPIAINVDAEAVTTISRKATRIGLIVNELVTNALKHAFPDDRAGTVSVCLKRSSRVLTLVVEDDGVGCPDTTKDGLGSRLVRLLVQELKGSIARDNGAKGCRVTITIPSINA